MDIAAAINRFFCAWSKCDGPWWEADAILGIYRCLDSALLEAPPIPLSSEQRKAMIPFLEHAWTGVAVPRVGAENHVRTNVRGNERLIGLAVEPAGTQARPARRRDGGLFPDLYCRTTDGSGFEWFVEVKLWSVNHDKGKSRFDETSFFGSMEADWMKWRHRGWKEPRLYLVGCLAMSPACFRGADLHCGNFEEFLARCKSWLTSHANSEPDTEWHVGIKQRRTDSHVRARYIVAGGGRTSPIEPFRIASAE